jgi:hypothetical protein
MAAPGNLAYLKSYGFKTFDRWIDESYDLEQDDDLRIQKVVAELKKLSALSINQLNDMYAEMKPNIEHNFNHFYNDFKKCIVTEMVNNFQAALAQSKITADIDYSTVIKRLSQ